MTFSPEIHREHGAVTASAIYGQGVVPARMRGRLVKYPTHQSRTLPVHASAHSLPLFLPSRAGRVVAGRGLRRLSPVAHPCQHFPIVIACLRRLASVFLLQLPQPPRLSRDEEPRLIQILLSGLYRAIQPAKHPRCGLGQCLQQSSLSVMAPSYVIERSKGATACPTKEFPISEKRFPRGR